MKERMQKGLALTLVFALFAGMLFVPTQSVYGQETTPTEPTTEATETTKDAEKAKETSNPFMKKLTLKWDLKNNKTRSITEKFAGVGKQKLTVKMTKYKVTKAKKEGYKKATFTLTFKRSLKPTKKQVHKMVNTDYCRMMGSVGGGYYFTVLDYYTGENLEVEGNSRDVTVTSKWTHAKKKTYKDNDGCWVKISPYSKVKVTIVYPEDYKGVCVGVGGNNVYKETSADAKFWEGKTKFNKTSFYKKGKKNSHWRRIK